MRILIQKAAMLGMALTLATQASAMQDAYTMYVPKIEKTENGFRVFIPSTGQWGPEIEGDIVCFNTDGSAVVTSKIVDEHEICCAVQTATGVKIVDAAGRPFDCVDPVYLSPKGHVAYTCFRRDSAFYIRIVRSDGNVCIEAPMAAPWPQQVVDFTADENFVAVVVGCDKLGCFLTRIFDTRTANLVACVPGGRIEAHPSVPLMLIGNWGRQVLVDLTTGQCTDFAGNLEDFKALNQPK